MDRVPFYGVVVVCNDDRRLREAVKMIRRRAVTYGFRKGSDFHIRLQPASRSSLLAPPTSHFQVVYQGLDLGSFSLQVPGVHNIVNATAAIAVGVGLDIAVDDIRAGLAAFRGVDRRFQLRGTSAGVSVIDDYGHHPTEIRATLEAARACGYRRVHVVFQPHRYSRTQLLMDDFAGSFSQADTLVLLDVYAATEAPIEGVNSVALGRRIAERTGRTPLFATSFRDAARVAAEVAEAGDMILTLGAGSVWQLGPMILERLAEQAAESEPGVRLAT
jgi:UDP-N-acetylmuramate--alanine ligase